MQAKSYLFICACLLGSAACGEDSKPAGSDNGAPTGGTAATGGSNPATGNSNTEVGGSNAAAAGSSATTGGGDSTTRGGNAAAGGGGDPGNVPPAGGVDASDPGSPDAAIGEGNGAIWYAGHSYTIGIDTIAQLGGTIAGVSDGGPYMQDYYRNRGTTIDPGLDNFQHFLFIDWIQNEQELSNSIAAANQIKAYLEERGVPEMFVMVQWFHEEPSATQHGLVAGTAGQALFNDLYQRLADATGVTLINVGDAFVEAKTSNPEIPLHSDGTHPSLEGQYLRNIFIYSYLSGADPRDFPAVNVSESVGAALREVAHTVLTR